jgi:hypothetical protein
VRGLTASAAPDPTCSDPVECLPEARRRRRPAHASLLFRRRQRRHLEQDGQRRAKETAEEARVGAADGPSPRLGPATHCRRIDRARGQTVGVCGSLVEVQTRGQEVSSGVSCDSARWQTSLREVLARSGRDDLLRSSLTRCMMHARPVLQPPRQQDGYGCLRVCCRPRRKRVLMMIPRHPQSRSASLRIAAPSHHRRVCSLVVPRCPPRPQLTELPSAGGRILGVHPQQIDERLLGRQEAGQPLKCFISWEGTGGGGDLLPQHLYGYVRLSLSCSANNGANRRG